MHTMANLTLTIIGCGNSNRCDDGVGVFVAKSLQTFLQQSPRNDVRVFDAGTAGMEVMFQSRGTQKLIIVDATTTGSEPGAIFKVPGEKLATNYEPQFNLHDFRWDHALFAGKNIFRDQFPSEVWVYLIEALSLDYGLDLSEQVRKSALKVITDIKNIIDLYSPFPEDRLSSEAAVCAQFP